MRIFPILAGTLMLASGAFAETFDVVVVGATTAGVGAAIAAGRQGMRVALIEETPTIGGLLANGLCNTDLRSPGGSSGLFEEFRLRSQKYYTTNFPDDPAMKNEPMAKLGFRYEPHIADKIIREMIAEIPSIKIFTGRYATRVLKTGNVVTGVVTKDTKDTHELTFLAAVTIDATHEGDLLPLAGAKFRLGREPRSEEEPHAGAIYMTHDGEILGSGEGDDKIQAFAMLATIKDYGPGVDKSIPQPPNYNPKNYAPEPKSDTFWFKGGVLPNHKYELNENMDGTDAADLQQGYITGDRAQRRKIWEKYRDYTLGYIYFRQHVMGETSIALADDEFVDNHNFPYELYVREGRRLEGVAMFKERDALKVPSFSRPPLRQDSIAVGDWAIDSHAVSRDTEGYIYFAMGDRFHTSAPYQAPYGIMVPKLIDGLLVPMAVSSTHVGFQVLRLEAIRVAMGQAAGNAAALCVKQKIQPRAVPVPKLQTMLLDQNQTLFYYTDVIPSTPHYRAIERISMAGVVNGYDDFSFKPAQQATHADAAKFLFKALNLKVKMDYTDLWDIMRWPLKVHNSQHCTPDHWGTYYLMTLYNMGAFSKQELADMNPDGPTKGAELMAWAKIAAAGKPVPLVPDGPVTRAELAQFVYDISKK
jgi:hypothetical protein